MCSFFLYGKKNRPFRGHKRKLVFCFDDCRFINVGTKNKDIWLSSLSEYQLLTNLPQIVKALCLAMDRKLAADEADKVMERFRSDDPEYDKLRHAADDYMRTRLDNLNI